MSAADVSLDDVLAELSKIRALDFRGYKKASLERRFRRRMHQLDVATYADYLEYFRSHPEEIDQLLQAVLINVTRFFRDPPAWEALRRGPLPRLLGRLRPGSTFRAWCAGCATGEEVYSLAILLAEHFGASLKQYDIKLYASDHDEDALNLARRGEYPIERVTLLESAWRDRYFSVAGKTARVSRELRRLAIFGRSNLVSDAPISHVHLLICRNVLIYFDVALQRQVLKKFRYALEDGGILFLGKAESQLRETAAFHPVDLRWRIFQAVPRNGLAALPEALNMDHLFNEHENLATIHRSLLETIRPGVVVIDLQGVVVHCNEASGRVWSLSGGASLTGKPLHESPLAQRCPQLLDYVERSRTSTAAETLRFECRLDGREPSNLEVTIRPILSPQGNRIGTLVYAEDVTPQQKLLSTVEELESTAEELHSANEELETTNEELQSTNEELETTNEELQSTNEELETTNEELHSLNEELETTNDELQIRTRDLEEMAARYAETFALMPAPVILSSDSAQITLWNPAAERLFGLHAKSVTGLELKLLPVAAHLRDALVRRHRQVLSHDRPVIARGIEVDLPGHRGKLDIHVVRVVSAGGYSVMMSFDLKPPAGAPRKKSAARKRSAPQKRSSRRKTR